MKVKKLVKEILKYVENGGSIEDDVYLRVEGQYHYTGHLERSVLDILEDKAYLMLVAKEVDT